MPSAMYDSSFITQRNKNKAIANSFINRMQNLTPGSAPLLGITQQSILDAVKSGQLIYYSKNDNGTTKIDVGCPCNQVNIANTNESITNYGWATNIGGTGSDVGNSIATDSFGNIYVIGYYNSSLNSLLINSAVPASYNGGPINVIPYGRLNNSGDNDVFIVKYNTSGKVLWATKIGGASSDVGNSITTDLSGNVIVTGMYISSSLQINSADSSYTPGPGSIALIPYGILDNSTGLTNTFIVKYNTNGTVLWATKIDGASFSSGRGITTDSLGNIYVTGNYNSSSSLINSAVPASYGGGSITVTPYGTLPTSGSSYYIFIVKYNTNGTVLWATIGGAGFAIGTSIATDLSNNVIVTGNYNSSPLTINSADPLYISGTITVTPYGTLLLIGTTAAFIVKYNTSGKVLWATNIGGLSDQAFGHSIATDLSNSIIVTGYYSSSSLKINSADSSYISGTITVIEYGTLPLVGVNDIFIVKYNTNGTVSWATKIGGVLDDGENSSATDISGNIYVTGYYASSSLLINSAIIFPYGGGSIAVAPYGTLPNSSSNYDAFIVKYNTNGTVLWVTKIGGLGYDNGIDIATDFSGNVIVTGHYASNPLTIYRADPGYIPGSGTINVVSYGTLINSGSDDAFIVKYNTNGIIS